MALEFTAQNFEQEVLKSDQPVLVDFFAHWCGPCQMISPIIDELSKEYTGKVKIGKIDVDNNKETAQKYEVLSIPTIILFRNGRVAEKLVGSQSKEKIIELLNKTV